MSGESEETQVLESTRKVLGTIEKLNNLDIIQQTEHEFLAKATEMEEQLLKNRIRQEEILEVIIRDRKIENMLEQ